MEKINETKNKKSFITTAKEFFEADKILTNPGLYELMTTKNEEKINIKESFFYEVNLPTITKKNNTK
jgi:hypothetical protein